MDNSTWGVVFLGVIAAASAIQGAFLVALLVFMRRLAVRFDALSTRIDRDISPAIENLTRVSRSAAEIADIAGLQARRIDLLLADTVEKVEHTTALVQQLVERPLRPLANVVAFCKGVQRGAEVLFRLDRDGERPERPLPRRHRVGPDDDDHLFI
jgi:hypothetical protein